MDEQKKTWHLNSLALIESSFEIEILDLFDERKMLNAQANTELPPCGLVDFSHTIRCISAIQWIGHIVKQMHHDPVMIMSFDFPFFMTNDLNVTPVEVKVKLPFCWIPKSCNGCVWAGIHFWCRYNCLKYKKSIDKYESFIFIRIFLTSEIRISVKKPIYVNFIELLRNQSLKFVKY